MAVNRTLVDAPVDTVMAVLSDPRAYARFVVGSKRVRRFDPNWPDIDSVFHHTIGVGPFMLRDLTRVTEGDGRQRLVLRAQMRPLAVNRVSFTVRPTPAGTEVEVEERAIEGPVALVWNPALDGLMWLRNQETLRRLKKMAEHRHARRGRAAAVTA